MPLISVIMSVYTDEKYLRKSVESILNQTFRDFEFIITDDCSKDNSLDILREYAKKDNRIVLIENKENLKLTKNLNNMLGIAKGDLIARMDSDDISFPDRFEKQVKIFKNNPDIDFVFTSTILIDDTDDEICETWRPKNIDSILKMMSYNDLIPHPSIMAKKEIFSKAGNYTEINGYGQEDKELWQKFIKLGIKFYYLNEPLLFYRVNPKGISYQISDRSFSYNHRKISLCLDNYHKKRAAHLFWEYKNKLKKKEILILLLKFIIPVKLRYYKVVLLKKMKIML